MNNLIEALNKIIVLGLTNKDLYCRTCGTWLKGRNDIDGHNKAFACGIAVTAIKDLARQHSTNKDEVLIDKIAHRLSGMTTEDWETWKSQPYRIKTLPNIHNTESLKSEAKDIIDLIENNQWK